jgi:glutathione synthase/RimK-type ligase-like ATP-grasp enzyme
MNALGLFYGALDFIATPDGRCVFLECNPDGQWKWIDEMHDGEIAEAFATQIDKLL